jgi:APA family basic amino acid/polyamine antiporter
MVAYGAIVALSFLVERLENPNKTVPKAMAIAMAVVLVFYLAVLMATLGLVSAGFLEANEGLRYIPLYAAASFLPNLSFLTPLISISAVLALVTTMIVTMALAAHTLLSCAENGVLPQFLAKTGKRSGAPLTATLVVVLITGLFAAFPQLTNILINLGALCNVIVVAIVCVTVLALRKKYPKLEAGHFRAPGGRVLPVLTLVILVASYIPSIVQGGWQLWGGHCCLLPAWYGALSRSEAERMRIACGVFDGVHTGHQALLSQKPDIVYVLPPRTEHVVDYCRRETGSDPGF